MFNPFEAAFLASILNDACDAIAAERMDLTAERVIFNPPATIVHWSDGTKTVAKCNEQDTFSEEVGFAMACAKKLFHPYEKFVAQFKNAERPYKKKDAAPTVQAKPVTDKAADTACKTACKKETAKKDQNYRVISLDELLKAFAGDESIGVEIRGYRVPKARD